MIVAIPDLLGTEALRDIRALIAKANFIDGKTTAGQRAKRVKDNEQVDRDSPERQKLQDILLAALSGNALFKLAALPKQIRPPLISRYQTGRSYGPHVDDALMGPEGERTRSDISATIFLNAMEDYDGGELLIHSPFGLQEVKLPAGHAVIYPSSTLHEVAPVTRGERLVAVTWMQSYVRDERQRQLLADALAIRNRLNALAPDAPETDLAFRLYTNLLRLWSET